MNFHLEVG